jgi:hypothetical protein
MPKGILRNNGSKHSILLPKKQFKDLQKIPSIHKLLKKKLSVDSFFNLGNGV